MNRAFLTRTSIVSSRLRRQCFPQMLLTYCFLAPRTVTWLSRTSIKFESSATRVRFINNAKLTRKMARRTLENPIKMLN